MTNLTLYPTVARTGPWAHGQLLVCSFFLVTLMAETVFAQGPDVMITTTSQVSDELTGTPETLTLPLPEMTATSTMVISPIATAEITLEQTFIDTFETFQPNVSPWQVHSREDAESFDRRTISSNEEQQLYVDPAFKGTSDTALGLDPFALEDGYLRLRGERAPDTALPHLEGYEYTSGRISTENHFEQQYGYFESRMKFPSGQGIWPAFWLMMDFDRRPNGQAGWPPEIDVVEFIGHELSQYHVTSHWDVWPNQQKSGDTVSVQTPSDSFHLYGVLWTPDFIVYYLDREPVRYISTKANQHIPMFMIVNLALGGRWPGQVDDQALPADLMVDWVAAWQLQTQDASLLEPVEQTCHRSELTTTSGFQVTNTENAWGSVVQKYATQPGQHLNVTARVISGSAPGRVTVRDGRTGTFLSDHDAPAGETFEMDLVTSSDDTRLEFQTFSKIAGQTAIFTDIHVQVLSGS